MEDHLQIKKKVKPVKAITHKEVSDITSKMLSGLLIVTDEDSGEVVVFDKDKKLITSDISANDILTITKYKDALVDFFVPEKNEFITITEDSKTNEKRKKGKKYNSLM